MDLPRAARLVAMSRPARTAALALSILSAAPARADLILQTESFTLSGGIGIGLVGFEAFDPALGTLDRVSVSVFGTFQIPVLVPPGQTTVATVAWDAFGLGRGFDFDPTEAAFLFPLTNPDPVVPMAVVLTTPFDLSFTLTELTDLTGFVPVSFGAGVVATPPLVAAQRDDFTLRFPGDSVMEQFLFFPPAGVPSTGPFAGGGSVILQYEFTPAAAVVPEPGTALPLAALGLGLALRRRRGRGPKRAV